MKDVEDNEAKRERDNEVACRGKFSYVPFGAGRHRCIGETFAYVQVRARTIRGPTRTSPRVTDLASPRVTSSRC